MQQQGASLRLGWLAGLWAARGYDGASKLEGLPRRRTSVQFARGRACVQGVCGCGWCVNRELSVTREIWTAGQERRQKERGGETRLLAEQCIIVVIIT